MNSLWPESLFLLALIPLIVAAYVWRLRRRRVALRYSSLTLVRAALTRQSQLRRHLPFALFLLALSSLIVALARPVAGVSVPAGQATIILALDVSLSMCQTDILPNRLEAAKAAALSFIQHQPPGTQIGIVAFAGFAEIIQAPTDDQELQEDAILSLTPARRTAVGSAILKAIDAIAEANPDIAPSTGEASPQPEPTPMPGGRYAPAIIVLLTDGASNAGAPPVEAAQQAAVRGIRVYTIGFGTERGASPFGGPRCPSGSFGGGGGGGGGGFRRGIDEATLKEVAEVTGGEYFPATDAGELESVFRSLPLSLITRQETVEISVAFAALGLTLAALAFALSLRWQPLP
jgi:Ca-activated chloride channel family protein